jgi:hypothetical protein
VDRRGGRGRCRCGRSGGVLKSCLTLPQAHGEAGWSARLVPVAVDGLIYASSTVLLDSGRRKAAVLALARWLRDRAQGVVNW